MPSYFVSAAGSNSNSGLTEALPWLTVAKVNASTFAAGDNVLFRRGDVWREKLIPPSSGSAGNPITFGAYGTGSAPVIAGSNALTGWVADTGGTTWAEVWNAMTQTGDSSLAYGGISARNHRTVILGANITASATQIRVKFKGHNTLTAAFTEAAIGPRKASSDAFDFSTTPTRLTQAASNAFNIATGSSSYSDAITFTLTSGVDYLVAFDTDSSQNYSLLDPGSGTHSYWKAYTAGQSQVADVTGYNSASFLMWTEAIESGTARAPQGGLYQASFTVAPVNVFRNGVQLGAAKASAAACVADGDWYYDAGVSLFYLKSTASPATDVIEATVATRTDAVLIDGRTYVALDGLQVRQASHFGVMIDSSQHVSVTGVEALQNVESGLNVQDAADDILIAGGSYHHNGLATTGDRNGIGIGGLGAASSNITVRGADCYANVGPNIEIATTDSDAVMATVAILKCLIRVGQSHGLQIGGGHTGVTFAGNVIVTNAGYGMYINQGTSGDPVIAALHNTIANNGTGGVSTANVYLTANSLTFKNNIVAQAAGLEIVKVVGVTLTASDFNLFYHSAGGNFMSYDGTPTTFAGWKTASSKDVSSVSVNPLFVNASSVFSLQRGSPAINAGVLVAVTSDIDGRLVPQGSAPDIGAYEYPRRSSLSPIVPGV